MSITLREAIDQTLLRLSLAQGVDVQTYAEEPIKQIIQHKFNILFDAHWWPQFYEPGETFTLDGASGVVTVDLVTDHGLKRFMDIRYVWYKDERNPLPIAPSRLNPALVKRRSIIPTNSAGKILKVLPVDTAGDITISFRKKPNDFENEDDIIDMDTDLIVLGSAYDYLNGIGTNPDEEAKLLRFFNTRYTQLVDAIERGDIATESYDSSYLTSEWQEMN